MNRIITVLSIVLMLSSGACKQSKEAATLPQEPVTTMASPSKTDSFPARSRLVISFFSIASGVDIKSVLRYEDFIGEYAAELGINIDYEKTHWGREGETDFCIELTELKAEQQADFVRRTMNLLETAEHVKIYENEPCRHRRKRE